jgi:transcriptional regulator with XRE-family HTH domain
MFYQRVEMQCARKGMSVTKLTKILGLSSSVITGWKKGASPRLSTVKMIADFFRVSPDALLTGEQAPDDHAQPAIPASYALLTDQERGVVNQLIEMMAAGRESQPPG